MDGTGQSVQPKTSPVPELEGEAVGRRTDFQHHGIRAGAVDRAGGDQEVVVFLCGNFVDVFFRIKRPAASIGLFQRRHHFFGIHAFLQAQVDMGAFLCVQDVIGFILCVGHAEGAVDVLCQRVYLQGQVLAAHGVQKIEADGELRSEPAVDLGTQKFLRMGQDQVHGRQFHLSGAEIQQDRVFFRHTVKAPGKVLLVFVQSADVLHPLAAPDTGVEVRLRPEGTFDALRQSVPDGIACGEFRCIFVQVHEPVHIVEAFLFVFVKHAPFDEESALDFPKGIFLWVVEEEVGHAPAVAQLHLPARHIPVKQRAVDDLRCPGANHQHPPAFRLCQGGFFLCLCQLFFVNQVLQHTIEHGAENPVLRHVMSQDLFQDVFVFIDVTGIDHHIESIGNVILDGFLAGPGIQVEHHGTRRIGDPVCKCLPPRRIVVFMSLHPNGGKLVVLYFHSISPSSVLYALWGNGMASTRA